MIKRSLPITVSLLLVAYSALTLSGPQGSERHAIEKVTIDNMAQTITPTAIPANPYGDGFQYPIATWTMPAPFAIQRYATSCNDYRQWYEHKRTMNPRLEESEAEIECSYQEREPVTRIDWFEAQQYCQSLDGRLPTEEEWIATAAIRGKVIHPCYPQRPIGAWAPLSHALTTQADEFHQCISKGWLKNDLELSIIEKQTLKAELLDELKSGQQKMAVDHSYPSINGAYGLGASVWEWTSSNWSANSDNNKVIKGGAFTNYQRPHLNHPLWRNYSHSNNRQAINIGFRCAWSL